MACDTCGSTLVQADGFCPRCDSDSLGTRLMGVLPSWHGVDEKGRHVYRVPAHSEREAWEKLNLRLKLKPETLARIARVEKESV